MSIPTHIRKLLLLKPPMGQFEEEGMNSSRLFYNVEVPNTTIHPIPSPIGSSELC